MELQPQFRHTLHGLLHSGCVGTFFEVDKKCSSCLICTKETEWCTLVPANYNGWTIQKTESEDGGDGSIEKVIQLLPQEDPKNKETAIDLTTADSEDTEEMQLFNMADSVSSYNIHSNISTNNEVTMHRYICYSSVAIMKNN